MNATQKQQYIPEWAEEAEKDPHTPNWVDYIPHQLWELEKVFFPIPTGKKGYNYPHHVDSYRYKADSKILNAYFEAGCKNYGIVCAGDLIVIDIDEISYVEDIAQYLPETIYQITGSRSGIHLFYLCKGVNERKTLFDRVLNERMHIGEIKADSNGYVVGPKSKHPSGNRYGPLKGDQIAEINKDDLMAAISDYLIDTVTQDNWNNDQYEKMRDAEVHELYDITADDVAPWLESNNRIAHPIHGSSTYRETGGSVGNFMKNEDGKTFVCWRCQIGAGDGCVLSGTHMLAMERAHERGVLGGGEYSCEWIRKNWKKDPRLHYYAWEKAIDDGLIKTYKIPTKVIEGYCIENDMIELGEKPSREQYYDVVNLLEWIITSKKGDIPELYV